MDIDDIINRYGISVLVDNIKILYRATNDIDDANKIYDEYYKYITGVYDKDTYHIIIRLVDYDLGTCIRKFDSIEDKV